MKYLALLPLLLETSLVAGLPGPSPANGIGKAIGKAANAKAAGAAAAGKGAKAAGAAAAGKGAKAAGAAAAGKGAKAAGKGAKAAGAATAGKGAKAAGAAKAGAGQTNAGQTNGTTAATGQTNNGQSRGGNSGQVNSNGQTNSTTQATGNTGNGNANTNANSGTPTASAPGNAVSAANVPPGANPFQALAGNAQFPTLTDVQKTGLQQAAVLWAQDTAIVSTALQLLGSGTMNDQDFRDAADMAYVAEVNELQQKSYIDALLGQMPQLQAATTSLTNGSFAIVVDQLREMRIRGPANQTFVQAAVQGMNNLRCRQVLLAIDTYVQTANLAAGNTSFISATRPPACQQVYAQTADTLPAGAVVNATTFPTAQQLITQFNQPPRFMLSNAVAFSQNSGNDNTPALGSQYTTNAPFSNTSSLAGQLLAFQGQPVQTNGDPTNGLANPLNAVLFANQVTTGANTNGNTNTNGNANPNTNASPNGNTNTNGNANTNTNASPNGNANTNANANKNGNANANANANQNSKGNIEVA